MIEKKIIHIRLESGETISLQAHQPPHLLKNEGTYGNGSIDWLPNGVLVDEILKESDSTAIAALCDGRVLERRTFITEDCKLQFIHKDDAIGQQWAAETAQVLVCMAMHQLYPKWVQLYSSEPFRYIYALPENMIVPDNFKTRLMEKLEDLFQAQPKMKTYLMNTVKAIQKMIKQGQPILAQQIFAQDLNKPVRVHETNEFIHLAGDMPLMPLELLSGLEVTNFEVLSILGYPVLEFFVQVQY